MVFASSWTESIQRWRCSLVGSDGTTWADMLLGGTKASVLVVMLPCVAWAPKFEVDRVDIVPGGKNGLLGAREIAAIVSVNVLLVSERSLLDSART